MSCNIDYYTRYASLVRDTWGRPVLEDKYDNLELWFYTSSRHNSIDLDTHTIYINTEDDIYNTFDKTIKAYEIVEKYFDYDFILVTNCSTVMNCQLLSYFVNNIPDYYSCFNYLYYMQEEFKYYYCFQGLFMLFPKFMIKWFIENQKTNIITFNNQQYVQSETHPDKYLWACNDLALAYLYDLYFRKNNLDIMQYTIFVPCAYYKKTIHQGIMSTAIYPDYFNIDGKIDLGYDITDINYYSKFLNVVCKESNMYEYLIEFNRPSEDTYNETFKNIYELSKMYTTNDISDNVEDLYMNIISNCKGRVFIEGFSASDGLVKTKEEILNL